MLKKILTLCLAVMMFSVTALASPGAVSLRAVYVADEDYIFTDAGSVITQVKEKATVDGEVFIDATHSASLPEAWDGITVSSYIVDGEEKVVPLSGSSVSETETLTVATDGYFEIENGMDLAAFARLYNKQVIPVTSSFRLVNDINLGSKPFFDYEIGGVGHTSTLSLFYFEGTFDGQGHTIYNLSLMTTGGKTPQHQRYSGLFRGVKNGGVIKNVKIINATMGLSTSSSSNAFPHSILCAHLSKGTISNVYVSGSVKNMYSSTTYGRVHMWGAICGQATEGLIENCHNAVNLTLSPTAKQNTDIGIYRSAASAVEYGSVIGIGGVVGNLPNGATATVVRNCGNSGEIYAPNYRAVAGVVGKIGHSVHKVENCYNTGNITGYGHVAGIIGWSRHEGNTADWFETNAYNRGDIVAVAEHTDTDTAKNRKDDRPYAAGILAHGPRDNNGTVVYSTGNVYTKTAANTDVNEVYTEAADGAYYNDGTKYVEITEETDLSTVTVRYNKTIGDGEEDDLGKDSYDADANPLTPDTVALLFSDNGSTTRTNTDAGSFYNAEYEGRATHYGTKVNDQGTEETDDDTKEFGNITTGTALTLDEFKTQETIEAMSAFARSNFVMDIGINDGFPIMQSQLDNVVAMADRYQIGSYTLGENTYNYELEVEVSRAGYVSLDVKPFGAEKVVIKAYTLDGATELGSTTISKAGIATVATGDETAVLIKATTGRAIIDLDLDGEQASGGSITSLRSGAIKVNLQTSEEAASVFIALYGANGALKAVEYAPAVTASDGQVSAVIDLTGEEVEGCTLKAFVWKNGKLAPAEANVKLQ